MFKTEIMDAHKKYLYIHKYNIHIHVEILCLFM